MEGLPVDGEAQNLRCPRCNVRPLDQEIQKGVCLLCNQALEPCATDTLPNENTIATPNGDEADGAPMAGHGPPFETGLKVLVGIVAGAFLLLCFYADCLPFWLGVAEEDLPAGKAIQAIIKGPGLPIRVWWAILIGTVSGIIGGLYGCCYTIYLLRRRK